jgi:RND family efflux transporter MFP subunit
MTPTQTTTSRFLILALAGLALAAGGAGAMYLYLRDRQPGVQVQAQPAATPAASGDIVIALTPEAVTRAGIRTERPTVGRLAGTVTIPGIVEPNTYNQVVVRSVAAGQVRSVAVELGAQVRRGDLLATIHSPELAETVREYLAMQSEFEAAHLRQTRLEGLVKIGAASQQELETAKAEHTRHSTDVESARSKLTLLGLTSNQIASLSETTSMDSTVRIASPRDGVITTRSINTGANIDASTELFTVADLSTVWVVANVFERDLGRMRVGATATTTASAMNDRRWSGRVSYLDPQLATDTRTAKVRIELPNADRLLKFGMYVDVAIATTESGTAMFVPRSAIQTIGAQNVVYITDAQRPGRYLERSVIVGPSSGLTAEILRGIVETDEVVVDGSFALRAERDRLGLPPPIPVVTPSVPPVAMAPVQKVAIAVTNEGFVPVTAEVDAGVPIELVFTRRTDETCAKEVDVPSLKVRKALPVNQPVSITVPAGPARTVAFACGMNMFKGTLVVR